LSGVYDVVRLLESQNQKEQGSQLLQIIDVQCPKCQRKFRTVPSVVEHAGWMYCSVCGTRMNISDPRPISSLSGVRSKDLSK
jgi:hypothetical protein